MASVTLSVCVRALKGKRLELSTPNLIHIYSYGSRLKRCDPEVKCEKVKVTRLREAVTVAWLIMAAVVVVLHLRPEIMTCRIDPNKNDRRRRGVARCLVDN